MDLTTRRFRSGRALGVLTLVVGMAACDNLLDVDRPGLITEEDLNSSLVDALVAAAEGEYHVAFNWVAHSGASATDEAIFSHGWTPWNDYDERDLSDVGCPHDACGFGYGWMQRARVTGVRSARQLQAMNAPSTAIARALNHAAYSTVLLADYLCEVPLNGGPKLTRAVAYDSAIALFEEAIPVAGTDAYPVNLANVGIARSYLNKNDLNQAIEFAAKVDQTFEAWIRYVASNNFGDWSTKYNIYHRTSGLEFNLALDPSEWATKRDLRVPFEQDSTRPMWSPSATYPRRGYFPYAPYSFEGWTPNAVALKDSILGGDDIRFASGLEAQYIIAEASLYGGTGSAAWTESQVLDFVNTRRAVGGHAAVTLAGDALKAELREQRKMDFYFAGYRLPDLIRYETYYSDVVVDPWPTGLIGGYPAGAPYQYGTRKCWPIAQSEVITNPNF